MYTFISKYVCVIIYAYIHTNRLHQLLQRAQNLKFTQLQVNFVHIALTNLFFRHHVPRKLQSKTNMSKLTKMHVKRDPHRLVRICFPGNISHESYGQKNMS